MPRIKQSPSYIYQRGTVYYFRLVIPEKHDNLLAGEVRLSLRTGNLKFARILAAQLATGVNDFMKKSKAAMNGISKAEIRAALGRYLRKILEGNEQVRLASMDPYGGGFRQPYGGPVIGPDSTPTGQRIKPDMALAMESLDIKDQLQGRPGLNDNAQINDFLNSEQLPAMPQDSDLYRYTAWELLKLRQALNEIEKERLLGNYTSPVEAQTLAAYPTDPPQAPSPPNVPVAAEEPSKPTGPSIGSLIDKWFKENQRANTWKPRTHKQYTGYFTIFKQILGEDKPIDSVDHATVRHIKETLMELPSGMNKKGVFKGKTVPEIIEINQTKGFETISVSTINGYITALGAFFKWCVGNGYMPANYADGAKIKVNRNQRPDQIRKAFTPADLLSLFGSPEYREDTFKESYQFWLPVLGLYTGARINELCQLRLEDVQEIDGIPSLVMQEDSQDKEVSIKNTASMRTVPLHPFIVDELNFMGHVQTMRDRGETRLFPELPYQNFNYGHKATKWFGRFKQKCGIDSKQLVFHSFRHTLSDNLKQQLITETLIDELTGHAVQGETMGRYGKRYSVEVLYNETVLKLNYAVNLEHLKKSRFTKH